MIDELKQKFSITEEQFEKKLEQAIKTAIFGKEQASDMEKKLYIIGRTIRCRED